MPSGSTHRVVGVISDTHGLLRPEVLSAFRDVTLILHAGDIGSPDVLLGLNALAKTIAVRGNNDKGEWARDIPEVERTRVGSIDIYMLHDLKEFEDNVVDQRVRVVVSGHSHQPRIEHRGGVLFLNPGSAGPRRFKLPVSVAKLTIQQSTVRARLIRLLST